MSNCHFAGKEIGCISTKGENEDRVDGILGAAARLIIHYGYDKTTMGDIAKEAGIGRGLVYLHFKNKDEIFEALLAREFQKYVQAWLEHIEQDPKGGTIGGIYRSVLYAINANPFMAAIVKQDRHILGNYLRKPHNMLVSLQSPSMWKDFLIAMQKVGAIRQDVNLEVMEYIMDMLSYGLVGLVEIKKTEDTPPFEEVMETIATMLDRTLTPKDGSNNEAGKALIRQLAAAARAQFEQSQKQTKKPENG
jgi:TetR/AcrR family acrAB operon transcriptional repressor